MARPGIDLLHPPWVDLPLGAALLNVARRHDLRTLRQLGGGGLLVLVSQLLSSLLVHKGHDVRPGGLDDLLLRQVRVLLSVFRLDFSLETKSSNGNLSLATLCQSWSNTEQRL